MLKFCSVVSVMSLSMSAFATDYNLRDAISDIQVDNIVQNIKANSGAPSGTKVSNISIAGSYSLDDQNRLSAITIQQLKFTAEVQIFFTLRDNVVITMSAIIPDGDCTKPQNIVVTETGTQSLIDGQIRNYLNSNASDLVTNNIIKMSDLVKYCTTQPQLNNVVTFF